MNEQISQLFLSKSNQQQQQQQKYAQNIWLKKPLKLHAYIYWHVSFTRLIAFTSKCRSHSLFLHFFPCVLRFFILFLFLVEFVFVHFIVYCLCRAFFFINRFYNEEELQRPARFLSPSHSARFSCHHRIKWPNFEIATAENFMCHGIGIAIFFFFSCVYIFFERRLQKRSWPNCNANLIAAHSHTKTRETTEQAKRHSINVCTL